MILKMRHGHWRRLRTLSAQISKHKRRAGLWVKLRAYIQVPSRSVRLCKYLEAGRRHVLVHLGGHRRGAATLNSLWRNREDTVT